MKGLVLNVMILLIYICYAAILAAKNKGRKVNYGLVALAVTLPTIATILLDYCIILIPYDFQLYYEIAIWLLSCLINVWSCCLLYKLFSGSSRSLVQIWAKDFRVWNVISCILVIANISIIYINYRILQTYLMDVYNPNDFFTSLTNAENTMNIVELLNNIQRAVSFLVYGVLMLTAILQKPADADKGN